MAMKPVLALKLGQQLRMTPQLQQAIKLLQLSTFDLQQEIQEALDSNLMLDETNPEESEQDEEPTSLDTPEETIEGQTNEIESSSSESDAVETDDQPPPLILKSTVNPFPIRASNSVRIRSLKICQLIVSGRTFGTMHLYQQATLHQTKTVAIILKIRILHRFLYKVIWKSN